MKHRNLLIGAHVSIAKGLHLAFGRGEDLGCTAIQIFTKNATQWKTKPLEEDEIRKFKAERKRTGILVVAHDSYLINLASPKNRLFKQSLAAFLEEMERAEQLGIPYLVMHPGSHTGAGEALGLKSIVRAFSELLCETSGYDLKILVENTAGQGTALGYSFEQISTIIEGTSQPERMGVCLDTCHAFAAGHDLRDRASYRAVMQQLDATVGLDRVKALHLNDSKKDLGLRVDRHEHIGKGRIGSDCFRLIMTDSRFEKVPKLLETPKELDGQDMDPVNLGLLRDFAAGKASA
jgi:deoxyribonuclease IV